MVALHLFHELDAVHPGHGDVGNDEIRTLRAHGCERVVPVRRLGERMAVVAEQGDEKFPVRRAIVNHQDMGHAQDSMRFGVGAADLRKAAICGTKVCRSSGFEM